MKKIILNFMLMLIALACLLNSTKMNAQFQGAVLTENAVGVSAVYPRCSGNDILDLNGDTYRVSTWDDAGTTQAIAWDVNYSGTPYTGTLTFATNIFDPDVCLVEDNTNVYAVIAYFDGPGTRWRWVWFVWTNGAGGWGFYQGAAASSFYAGSGTFGTTVNVDGNDNGEFGFVWDDGGNGNIYARVGDLTGGNPALYSTNVNIASGISPDVSMYFDGSNDILHIAYLDGNGDLNVDDHTFSNLSSGANSASPVYGTPLTPAYTFAYPRIASPNRNNSSTTDMTVVVEDNNGSSRYWIEGYNNGGTTPIIYNDGTGNSPADITQVQNLHIAVAYDDRYPNNGIWVGWGWNNSPGTYNGNFSGMVDWAEYPVVLQCDNVAVPLSGTRYWQVPTVLTANGDVVEFLSLAGRYASDRLFLTYNDIIINAPSGVWDIYTKEATPSSATSLRTGSKPGPSENPGIDLFNTTYGGLLSLKLFDLTGKIILEQKDNINNLKNIFRINSKDIPKSAYLVQVISEDTSYYFSQKIFIGN